MEITGFALLIILPSELALLCRIVKSIRELTHAQMLSQRIAIVLQSRYNMLQRIGGRKVLREHNLLRWAELCSWRVSYVILKVSLRLLLTLGA